MNAEDGIDAIDRRIADLRVWLRDNAPEVIDEQKHLDAETVERAYWNYGYFVALKDLRDLLCGRRNMLH